MTMRSMLAAMAFLAAVVPTEAAGYRLECPSRDVDRAIRGCTIAIGARSTNLPAAYANRCVAYWLKGAYERAAFDCHEAIQHGGAFAAAHLIRGVDRADKGDHRTASADYSRSLDLFPTASAYYNRGTAYLAMRDYSRALADFDKAIATPPGTPQAHINRALALLPDGRTDEIVAALDLGVSLLHGDPLASAIRRQVLEALGPATSAGSGMSNRAIAIEPFPPSKVIPDAISIETFSANRVAMRVEPYPTPSLALSPGPPASGAPPKARLAPVVRAGPAAPRDSLAECVRLWHPETQTTQRRWHEICRNLDFGRPGVRGDRGARRR